MSKLLFHTAHRLRAEGRGVFRVGGRVAAFGNEGMQDYRLFRSWLRRYGYNEDRFACLDGGASWVVLLSHPLGPPHVEAVEHGLWVAWAAGAVASDEARPTATARVSPTRVTARR